MQNNRQNSLTTKNSSYINSENTVRCEKKNLQIILNSNNYVTKDRSTLVAQVLRRDLTEVTLWPTNWQPRESGVDQVPGLTSLLILF
jgi:NADPH-dependent 7-cyano-7-deazaguanine reductase QueF-like protein